MVSLLSGNPFIFTFMNDIQKKWLKYKIEGVDSYNEINS